MAKVTNEQIQEWKKKHGTVYHITVDGKECFLKRPSRKTIGYASAAGKDDPMKFNEVVLRDCWLGGDEEIKTDDVLFMSVSGELASLIELKRVELKKL